MDKKEELEMKAVAWNHRVMAMIIQANFKIIKKEWGHLCALSLQREALLFKILVLTNSNELIKQVLCHSLKNNHLEPKSIDKKVIIQMLLTVIQELFPDFQGLPNEVPIYPKSNNQYDEDCPLELPSWTDHRCSQE